VTSRGGNYGVGQSQPAPRPRIGSERGYVCCQRDEGEPRQSLERPTQSFSAAGLPVAVRPDHQFSEGKCWDSEVEAAGHGWAEDVLVEPASTAGVRLIKVVDQAVGIEDQ